jgi:hypothetical protein
VGDQTPPVRFQRFRDRLAGRPAESALRRDIPDHLAVFLREWTLAACGLDDRVAQRAAALRLGLKPPGMHGGGADAYVATLQRVARAPDLLDVVDAILAVHRAAADLRALPPRGVLVAYVILRGEMHHEPLAMAVVTTAARLCVQPLDGLDLNPSDRDPPERRPKVLIDL